VTNRPQRDSEVRQIGRSITYPKTSNFRAFASPGAPPNVSTGGPTTTSTKLAPRKTSYQAEHESPPAMQSVHRSTLQAGREHPLMPAASRGRRNTSLIRCRGVLLWGMAITRG
jgi:hypothetical protein